MVINIQNLSSRECGNNKNKSLKLTHYNTLEILNSKWKFKAFQNPLSLKIQKITPSLSIL
jgi:hypothetical protein